MRFELPRHGERISGGAAWPETHKGDIYLFAARPGLRCLRVLVDADSLVGSDQPWGEASLLSGMLALRCVQTWRYADEGPPASLPRRVVASLCVAPGWVELDPEPLEDGSRRFVRDRGEGSVSWGGLIGNRARIAANDVHHPAYVDLLPEQAAKRREADSLAAQIAE